MELAVHVGHDVGEDDESHWLGTPNINLTPNRVENILGVREHPGGVIASPRLVVGPESIVFDQAIQNVAYGRERLKRERQRDVFAHVPATRYTGTVP